MNKRTYIKCLISLIIVLVVCSCSIFQKDNDNADTLSNNDVQGIYNDISKNAYFMNHNNYINRGLEKARNNDTIGAIEDFSKYIESFPDDFVGYLMRAAIYNEKKYFSLAIEDYNKVLLLDTLNDFKANCYSGLGQQNLSSLIQKQKK
jgi:Tfp pilus assembly protein PilF